jgi:hypothetical protein
MGQELCRPTKVLRLPDNNQQTFSNNLIYIVKFSWLFSVVCTPRNNTGVCRVLLSTTTSALSARTFSSPLYTFRLTMRLPVLAYDLKCSPHYQKTGDPDPDYESDILDQPVICSHTHREGDDILSRNDKLIINFWIYKE